MPDCSHFIVVEVGVREVEPLGHLVGAADGAVRLVREVDASLHV